MVADSLLVGVAPQPPGCNGRGQCAPADPALPVSSVAGRPVRPRESAASPAVAALSVEERHSESGATPDSEKPAREQSCSSPTQEADWRPSPRGAGARQRESPPRTWTRSGPFDEVAPSRYLRVMRSVGIKVLNSKLSEYVRLAASGETILVTDRDRVVAELGPLRETRSPILADAFLADAVRSGVMTPPALAASGPPPAPPAVARLDEVLADLDESRSDR